MGEGYKRFSDFVDPDDGPLRGTKIKISDILDQDILITNYKIAKSKFHNSNADQVLTLQFQYENELCILFTGSGVLKGQVTKYESELPFVATIRREGKCFRLS